LDFLANLPAWRWRASWWTATACCTTGRNWLLAAAPFGRVREELVHVLTRYHDATGTPVTIFFDGSGAPAGTPPPESIRRWRFCFQAPDRPPMT